MPWKESSVMDERLRFVARALDGEAMTEACRAFGISRKTGCTIFSRDKEHGQEAPSDRSRRPERYANQLPGPAPRAQARNCHRTHPARPAAAEWAARAHASHAEEGSRPPGLRALLMSQVHLAGGVVPEAAT